MQQPLPLDVPIKGEPHITWVTHTGHHTPLQKVQEEISK